VLFSDENVAAYINENFEPAWQSVRPVPTVTIDFGNGKIVKRTLHGNVATYVCNDDGTVLDVLPGIYQPRTYLDRLGQLQLLYRYVQQETALIADPAGALHEYHASAAAALSKNEPYKIAEVEFDRPSIVRIEKSVKIVLNPADRIQARLQAAKGIRTEPTSIAAPKSSAELPHWRALATDTEINETQRRLLIHQHLLETGKTTPDELKKWLYKEVLHADLDDPYLGLGSILFDAYPFAEEDQG